MSQRNRLRSLSDAHLLDRIVDAAVAMLVAPTADETWVHAGTLERLHRERSRRLAKGGVLDELTCTCEQCFRPFNP